MNDYFLLPTVCIQYKNGKYFLKNVLYNYEKLQVERLDEIFPQKKLFELKIFALVSEKDKVKKEMFSILESKYRNSEVTLGYIETTANCPYKCKMCPKGTNELERNVRTMDVKTFQRIIEQLHNQDDITLHLFGDPLYDESIYEKIRYANDRGIKPSFSTNLASLKKIKIDELKKIKMKYITISLDSIFPDELAGIRGKITGEQMKENWKRFEEMVAVLESVRFAQKICVQSIRLNNNERTRMQLKRYVKGNELLEFYEKPYIEFPNTNKMEYALETIYRGEEWFWLYHILKKKTPYRCLKPWNRKETAILSDGKFVPCCMCYNAKYDLGSVLEEELELIQNGDKFFSFRKKIWESNDCGEVCNSCFQNRMAISHSKIPMKEIRHLQEFCLDTW